MAVMEFMMELFVRICWIWIQVSSEVYRFERNVTLTWFESHKYCADKGKVLFDVKKNVYDAILMDILNDTDQAWIANTVELSDFIKMPVCKRTTGLQSDLKHSFETDIISNCLTFCKDYRYIGLKETHCFCIMNNTSPTRSKVCEFTCNKDPVYLCGGNESVSVYEKVNTNITRKIAPGFKNCVYAEKNDGALELFTASCVGGKAEGGMCNSENTSECSRRNWTLVGSDLCRMDLKSSYRWTQVRQFCTDIGGQLVSPNELRLNLENDRTYWLGIHRITKIHEAKENNSALEETVIKNNTYCAVARKEGDLLLLEGEDCEAKHAILCQESTETPGKGSNSEHTAGTIIYVVVAVSAILLVAIVITSLACLLRRRQNSQHTEVRAINSSSEHEVLVQNISTNPPAKPLRKAHSKKEHVQSSYDNIVPVCSEQDVDMLQPGHSNSVEEDYDKIEFDKEHRQDKDINNDGQRIYDHTFLCMTDDQYDLTDLSSDNLPFLDETYHTTTLAPKLNTTHLVHGEDSQLNLEICTEVDNDLYTTMGHT